MASEGARSVPDAASLLAQSPDGVVYADQSGTIRAWNEAAARIFGFTAKEALGQSLDIIIPERFREAHWKGFERALRAGSTKYAGLSLPTRAQTKGGAQIYVELGFGIVLVGAEAVGAIATVREITQRYERERAQRQRIEELEREIEQRKA